MDRWQYLLRWNTDDIYTFSVFSSRAKADEAFDKAVKKFNLIEQTTGVWHLRFARGNGKAYTASGKGSLILQKILLNNNYL